MRDKSELGTMVQQEDDGTYTAVAAMNGLTEDMAEEMAIIMREAISDYLERNGVHTISVKDMAN